MRKVLLISLLLLTSGCSPKIYPPVERTDSVRVEIRERIDTVTAYVEIPFVKEVNATRDTLSHLENDYCASDASVSGGLLKHSLETKPQKRQTDIPVVLRDTLIIEKEAVTVTKYVEKELTRWQKLLLLLGKIFVVMACTIAVCALIQFFNKIKK